MDHVRNTAAPAAPVRIEEGFVSAMVAHYNDGTPAFCAEHLAKQNKGHKLRNLTDIKEGYNKNECKSNGIGAAAA